MTNNEKPKQRRRIHESDLLNNFAIAEMLKQDILENHPQYLNVEGYVWKDLDKVKIVRRPVSFRHGQRYRRHNRPADKYQVIIYSRPE